MQILLISGISGSGKSVALNVLEDNAFYCVDNLPPTMLAELINTLAQEKLERLAVAIDTRSAKILNDLPAVLQQLRASGHDIQTLFLTASTETLVARFSETRRRHPLTRHISQLHQGEDTPSLIECIEAEREILAEIQLLAQVIDTSDLSANQLRNWIKELIAQAPTHLTLMFESFAFKRGVPIDADFVFDVRMLPNPHYDAILRPLTGRDQPVIDFLENQAMVAEMFGDIRDFIAKWLPAFERDNRSYLTVAIGCTGGQHRSVYMVEKLAAHFRQQQAVLLRHRRLS